MLLPFTLEALCALRGWGSYIYFLEEVVFIFLKKFFTEPVLLNQFFWTIFLLNQFLFEPVFLFLTKNQKKTARGLYYKYEVSIKKSLLYGTCRRKKMVPFVENLLRDGTFRRNFRKALFSETQKCPQKTQKWPLGYFIKSMPLVANANAVAISLIRFVRVGVGQLYLFSWRSCFLL